MLYYTNIDFIRESNKIEGIRREPTQAEIETFEEFLQLPSITLASLKKFVKVYQPNAVLRNKAGLNVRVGTYIPPKGGPHITEELKKILESANAGKYAMMETYAVHHLYESLHPFTDGNGRSGRMLWRWMMREAPLGFLHHWYYQSLAFNDRREK